MEKIKYECLDCGHKFDGDLSTDQCPNCHSTNIRKVQSGIPPIVWKILATITSIIVAVLLIRGCRKDNPITADLTVMDNNIKITVQGVSDADLKSKYQIVMVNDSDSQAKDYHFNGKNNTISIDANNSFDYQFISGVTYTFNFIERHSKNAPSNFRWSGDHTYYHPFPPVAPQISVSKVADCTSNTYTITVSVEKGSPDKFYLDGDLQSGLTFYDIAPRASVYRIKAYDSTNDLWSEVSEISCKPIHPFRITEEEVNKVLSSMAQRRIQPGSALEKINNNNDIKLSKPIDGNSTLEGALDFSYNQKIKYSAKVKIAHEDCNDQIVEITLSK